MTICNFIIIHARVIFYPFPLSLPEPDIMSHPKAGPGSQRVEKLTQRPQRVMSGSLQAHEARAELAILDAGKHISSADGAPL